MIWLGLFESFLAYLISVGSFNTGWVCLNRLESFDIGWAI